MKKLLYIVMALVVLVLAGCTAQEPIEVEETTIGDTEMLDMFTLSIAADNSVYQADEEIKCHAILSYHGDEPITIYHSDPLIVFGIEDGDMFTAEYCRNDVLMTTELEPEQEITVWFAKNGGWSADDPNAAFYEAFYKEKELRLPKGEYTLSVQFRFATDEDDIVGTMQSLTTTIDITVK